MNNIEMQVDQGVAFITLNRPEKFNSFIREMALDLQSCLDICSNDDSIRAIYLTGTGKAFCAGQDLQEAIDAPEDGLKKIVGEHYNPIIKKITNIEKPVIAAVNGVAAGAGANIALACDIVIATESASFIQAFSKIGLVPDSAGTYTLPRLVGYQRASALMMTGDKVGAEDAMRMGMIYKFFADELFEESSKKLAYKMAKMPTIALGKTKRLLQASISNNIMEQAALEETEQFLASQTYDYKEGVQAFLEKRKPEFKGR